MVVAVEMVEHKKVDEGVGVGDGGRVVKSLVESFVYMYNLGSKK